MGEEPVGWEEGRKGTSPAAVNVKGGLTRTPKGCWQGSEGIERTDWEVEPVCGLQWDAWEVKGKQGSRVSPRFQNRETEWVVGPFIEMRKLMEERKEFIYGQSGGEMKVYEGLRNYFLCLCRQRSLCTHGFPVLLYMLEFELGRLLGSFYPLNKCKK